MDAQKKGSKKTGVLGRQTLAQVWADIKRMELPSSVGRVPIGVGKAARGKLKADEWRTFCNVNLVHTLGRKWGSLPDTARRRQLLDNYMDLVTATKLSTRRVLTVPIVEECGRHIERYLGGLRTLFPLQRITPNQHLAAHLPQLLFNFGPSHAWRCFPFERYNQILQRINTNHISGAHVS